ncbi:hypothetical protein [Actinoallomurus sp. NPDC050550]|uniref:hypothetical protein n=1 Tax=Actinoallomurus sp. NPDC050550 TaxID=3154937 RepID=UPI0033D37F4C
MATKYTERDKECEDSLEAVLNTPGLFTSEADRDAVTQALRDAYNAAWETIAPFYVRAVHRMLEDVRAAAARGAIVASVGRDGENVREIVLAFEPGLGIIEIPLNRSIVRRALADLKHNHGRAFPDLDAMLGTMSWKTISPEEMANAAQNLKTLLRRLGLPVDEPEPRKDIILLDNGMRGTARAALKQMYWPQAKGTLVQGFYLFRTAAYFDPQPNADRGYLFDLDADTSDGGKNLYVLPDDPDLEGLTFRAEDALVLIEVLTSGPKLSTDRIDAHGHPVQRLFRDEPLREKSINPVRRSARYLDPRVYEGVLRTIRAAIGNHARYAARHEQDGADVQELLRPGHERMVKNTRAWIAGDLDAMHPGLRELAGTYCWTNQWPTIAKLADAINAAGLSAETARTVWAEFDELRDDTARKAFIERLTSWPTAA